MIKQNSNFSSALLLILLQVILIAAFTYYFPLGWSIWQTAAIILLISSLQILFLTQTLKRFYLIGFIIALFWSLAAMTLKSAGTQQMAGIFSKALLLLIFIHLTWQMSRSKPYVQFWFGNAALWAISYVCIFILSLFLEILLSGSGPDKIQVLALYQRELRSGLILGLAGGIAFDLHRTIARLLRWDDFSKSS